MTDIPLPFDDEPDPGDLPMLVADLIDTYGYEPVLRTVLSQEPTIAVPSAPARWTDPETSQMAAKKEADVGKFTDKSGKARLLYVFSTGDFTHQQATVRVMGAQAAISAFEGTRRRCSDLSAVNFIYDTGKRRKNPGSDDDSIVWGITLEGREALIRLDDTGCSR